MTKIEYALQIVKEGYEQCLKNYQDVFCCQLVNDNKGFNYGEIQAIAQRLKPMHFDLPVHVSILPAGKKTSSQYLFDGLQEIYCNCDELRKMLDRMRSRKIGK